MSYQLRDQLDQLALMKPRMSLKGLMLSCSGGSVFVFEAGVLFEEVGDGIAFWSRGLQVLTTFHRAPLQLWPFRVRPKHFHYLGLDMHGVCRLMGGFSHPELHFKCRTCTFFNRCTPIHAVEGRHTARSKACDINECEGMR